MITGVKYLILLTGFLAAFCSLNADSTGAGITSAGAFIAFSLLEIQDLKILNEKEEEENEEII